VHEVAIPVAVRFRREISDCLAFPSRLYISTQLQPAALRSSFCVRAPPARPARIRVTGATGACSSAEARARDVVVANESWTQLKGKILPPSSRRLPWKDHGNDPTAACPASAKGFSAPESRFGQSGSRLGILSTGIGPAWNFRLKARLWNVIDIDAQSVKSVLCQPARGAHNTRPL